MFRMKFPDCMKQLRTMMIGIDVCHAGPASIAGFAASTNPETTQYFSQYFVQ